jgi:hypothetical protein
LLFVLAAALVAAPTAAAADGFYEARVLEPAASYVAGKPIEVWCATSVSAWHSYEIATYGVVGSEHGSAPFGGSVIYLDTEECPPLRQQLSAGGVYVPTLAATVEIITHESIHARGERNEGVTDCDAMHEMPGVAVRFFHVRAGKQLRALMAAAWTVHRAEPLQYLTVC